VRDPPKALKVKADVEAPPKDFKDIFDRLAAERGL